MLKLHTTWPICALPRPRRTAAFPPPYPLQRVSFEETPDAPRDTARPCRPPAYGTWVATLVGVLDTQRPLASLPADLLHTCPVCGHDMAVMVADLPKGRLTQCASCGELDYRRKAVMPVAARTTES